MQLEDIKKPNKYYRAMEVAKFMGISHPTLYRMVREGKIKAINIAKTGNRSILAFRPEDIQEFYDSIQNSSGIPAKIRKGKKPEDFDK